MAPLVLICLCLSSHFSPAAHEAQGLSQDFFLCPWGVGRPLKGLGHATIVTAHFLSETSSSATSYSSEFSKRLLSTYICKVLGNLQLNLLSKSKVYEDPALSAIFLHNNYNYILKSLEK